MPIHVTFMILSFRLHFSSERGMKDLHEEQILLILLYQVLCIFKDKKYIDLPGEFNRFPKVIGNRSLKATFPE